MHLNLEVEAAILIAPVIRGAGSGKIAFCGIQEFEANASLPLHPGTRQLAQARARPPLQRTPSPWEVANLPRRSYVGGMLDDLKANNRNWADRKVATDPGFFKRLVGQQAPKYLWIGCSDSRVPANEIIGLDPGEVFVHRNIANLAPPQDANYLSVLQFAVETLKVEHILVVGHYGCGGVAAAVDGKRRGLIDHWVHPIREVHHDHKAELEALEEQERWDRLVELNVVRQVKNVASDVFVQDAWLRGQPLMVHGWVYSIADGLIRDLNVSVSRTEDVDQLR